MAQKILFGYILVMSIVAFCVCGADKFAAQRQKSRVPERCCFCCRRWWECRNVSWDVYLPTQDQTLVFCSRYSGDYSGPGGIDSLLYPIIKRMVF
mgnify:CR=1 FL=1